MGSLFLSFSLAIGGAICLVALSKAFNLETYTTRIFPLIPIIYAIIYEVLEKRRSGGKAKSIPPSRAKEEMKAGVKQIFKNITVGRVFADVGVSYVIKLAAELLFLALYIKSSGHSFTNIYGDFGIETIGRFLRGDHPWLSGAEGFYLLSILAVITSFGTGLWIGYTTKAQAILEGVIVGAVATLITAMTNMLILYREIERMADQMAKSLGYGIHIGFIAVLTIQVLLYGLWSGIAQKAKQERETRTELKRSTRRGRK